MKPKVSVLMATYNRGKDIRQSIDSVINQTFKDFELIIINDGSTDDTEKFIKEYKDPRIVYLKKENGGQASARNLGIKHAQGKYIAYCDHDDLFHPSHLEHLNNYLDQHPEIDLVHSNANIISFGKFSHTTDFSHPRKKPEKDLYFVPMPSTMIHRKSSLGKTGLWDEHQIIRMGGEDWDMWLRFKDSCHIAHLPKILTDYTVHGKNMNTGKIRLKAMVITRTYVFKKRFLVRKKKMGFLKALVRSLPEMMRILG